MSSLNVDPAAVPSTIVSLVLPQLHSGASQQVMPGVRTANNLRLSYRVVDLSGTMTIRALRAQKMLTMDLELERNIKAILKYCAASIFSPGRARNTAGHQH
jgi:hypothetical protein